MIKKVKKTKEPKNTTTKERKKPGRKKGVSKYNHKNHRYRPGPMALTREEERDIEIEAKYADEHETREEFLEAQRKQYKKEQRKQKALKKKGMIKKIKLKELHSTTIDRYNGKKERKRLTTKRKNDRKEEKREFRVQQTKLNQHLYKGGSIKDEKSQKIIQRLKELNGSDLKLSRKEILDIKGKAGSKEVPSILDFNITLQEARFVTEYTKDYDELRAAKSAKLITNTMSKEVQEEIVNETLNNPNVYMALESTVREQISRTLITSDRTLSQIAKIAFSDPLEMFKDDGSGALKDIKDIPPFLRACISEMTHQSTYDGRGAERRVTGHITRIKLHDSLKALQILLKDIRDKTAKTSQRVNLFQFNSYGPSGTNIQDRLKDLSSEELDVLLKLSSQGVENSETFKKKELPAPEDVKIEDSAEDVIEMSKNNLENGSQLYELNDLKEIEKENL